MKAPRVLAMGNSMRMFPTGGEASALGRLTQPTRWARPSVPKPHTYKGRRALPDLVAARKAMNS